MGFRAFLHFKQLHCCSTWLTLASHFPMSEKNLPNIPDLWEKKTSIPIDLNHKLGGVLFIYWYCLVFFNLAVFWQPCPPHLLFLPWGWVRGYIVSGRCLLGPFCPECSEFIQNPESKMVAPRTVYDELIIYEMSVVMKIGHLPEATQFTVTEVFTFLITPSSSRLYTLLAKGQRAESRPDKMTCLRRLLPLHFTCADIVAWWQECARVSREVQTDKIHETRGTHSAHRPA